jgi:hypothetical protein
VGEASFLIPSEDVTNKIIENNANIVRDEEMPGRDVSPDIKMEQTTSLGFDSESCLVLSCCALGVSKGLTKLSEEITCCNPVMGEGVWERYQVRTDRQASWKRASLPESPSLIPGFWVPKSVNCCPRAQMSSQRLSLYLMRSEAFDSDRTIGQTLFSH